MIPAYNEAPSIEATLESVLAYLQRQSYQSELIVVDDGSKDETSSILDKYATGHPRVRVLRNQQNLGKGGSVKRGMLAARGKFIFFMDADLSAPIEELGGAFAALSRGSHPVLIGSRRISGARIERRQPRLRECLGFGFTLLARGMLSPAILDFTCGFKGFRRDAGRRLFQLQQCENWAFDAEILYLARLMNTPVLQYPVRWEHKKNSRVRFPRDIYRTLAALMRIRWMAARAFRHHAAASAVAGGQNSGEH